MLSIIIPTLNEEKYIKASLNSIKKQIFNGEYEIIVADFNSKDKTVEIAKSFGCKITSGGLPAKGRNEAAKIAKGDIFLFMDGDTILPDGFLEKSISEFEQRKLDIAGFPIVLNEQDNFLKFGFDIFFNWFPAKFAGDSIPYSISSILVRKEIHQKIGGFDESIKIGEDIFYGREGAKIGRFGLIKSCYIIFSARRFDEDGLFHTIFKEILYEIYTIFFGKVTSNIFNYQFNHYQKRKNILEEVFSLIGLLFLWPFFALIIVIKVFLIKIKIILSPNN